jgi:hypothetical protein
MIKIRIKAENRRRKQGTFLARACAPLSGVRDITLRRRGKLEATLGELAVPAVAAGARAALGVTPSRAPSRPVPPPPPAAAAAAPAPRASHPSSGAHLRPPRAAGPCRAGSYSPVRGAGSPWPRPRHPAGHSGAARAPPGRGLGRLRT